MRHKKTTVAPENFHALVDERIDDPVLRRNLHRATNISIEKRRDAVRDFDDWEGMRNAAHEIKRTVMRRLPYFLELFQRNAERNSMRVLYAADAEEGCRIVIDECRRRNARHVVKAKSMVTEEIGLGHALEREGIESVETDLGEFIVQLANEIPSHITAPALHKSRDEIGRLFADRLGMSYTNEPEQITAFARRMLREKFLNAEIGISGANFLVAETGSVCLIENEGNIRLSTTLPRCHIVVTGIEKVIPDLESLDLFLKLLARSATGQRMTSYTSLVNGPRRTVEPDGPDELIVILLDNGRTRMLADDLQRAALYCIRCGACMNVCPVYRNIGGHSYGSVYSGPIGSILTPIFQGFQRGKILPFASSLCGACAEICPVKIDIHHGLLGLRKNVVDANRSTFIERLLFRFWYHAMRSTRLYRASGVALRLLYPLLRRGRGIMMIPVWSRTRDFPSPPVKTFRRLWKEEADEAG